MEGKADSLSSQQAAGARRKDHGAGATWFRVLLIPGTLKGHKQQSDSGSELTSGLLDLEQRKRLVLKADGQ